MTRSPFPHADTGTNRSSTAPESPSRSAGPQGFAKSGLRRTFTIGKAPGRPRRTELPGPFSTEAGTTDVTNAYLRESLSTVKVMPAR